MVTVVLVDDERLIRSALRQTLSDAGIEVIGEAASGEEALELVLDLRPDVVLMDIKLPGIPGQEAIKRLGLLAPASHILVLARTEQNQVIEAIVAGASGYILKTAPAEAIISAVEATAPANPSSPPRSPGNSCNASVNSRSRSSRPAQQRPAGSAPP
jgi:DNA-binding NarL/FixJ family response regulator